MPDPAPRPRFVRGGAALVVALLLLAACSSSRPQTPGPTAGGPGATDGAPSASAPAATTDLPTGGIVTDATKLCDLLGPGDFEVAGIPGAGLPEVNSDGPGSAYCVHAGDSAATGGIEFDAFVDDDPSGVYETITSEGAADLAPVDVGQADEAEARDGVAGEADRFAMIVVRSGKLVFTIGAPGGPGMAARLTTLAELVIERGSGLAS